jgi:hypothetical protein
MIFFIFKSFLAKPNLQAGKEIARLQVSRERDFGAISFKADSGKNVIN